MSHNGRFTGEGELLPGSDRTRERFGAIPTLIGEISGVKDKQPFPFISWAHSAGFRYAPESSEFFCRCESAAEAFFVRGFTARDGISYVNGAAVHPSGTSLRLQVRRGSLRMDAVVERGSVKLAVEVDGMTFHARKYDQVAADYLRERRLIACGFVLVRFTAQEVFADSAACWAQLDTILTAHTPPTNAADSHHQTGFLDG